MPKERNSFKYKVWRIVVSTPFEYFIMMLIILNTLLLMMKVCTFSLNIIISLSITQLYNYIAANRVGIKVILALLTESPFRCFQNNKSRQVFNRHISKLPIIYTVNVFF